MKRILIASAVLTMCFLGADSSSAAQLTLGYGTARSGNGGEFLATSSDGWAASVAASYSPLARGANGTGFETFCLERYEYFTPGGTYYYQISDKAIKGGTTTGDLLSVGTGYLMGLFARGVLPGYDYTASTTSASAGALQNTIWALEGESITMPSTFQSLLTAEFGASSNWTLTTANSTSYGLVTAASFGVAALNLGTTADGNGGIWPNQDQVFYRGGGFQTVPDGGTTLMLLGTALCGLSLLRRKLA